MTPSILAARKATAQGRIASTVAKMAIVLNVQTPSLDIQHRDPSVAALFQLEALASALEALMIALPTEPPSAPEKKRGTK